MQSPFANLNADLTSQILSRLASKSTFANANVSSQSQSSSTIASKPIFTNANVSSQSQPSSTTLPDIFKLSSVEDEDEFLYGESNSLPDEPKPVHRVTSDVQRNIPRNNIWSDDEDCNDDTSNNPLKVTEPLKTIKKVNINVSKTSNVSNFNTNFASFLELEQNKSVFDSKAELKDKLKSELKNTLFDVRSPQSFSLNKNRSSEQIDSVESKSKYHEAALLLKKKPEFTQKNDDNVVSSAVGYPVSLDKQSFAKWEKGENLSMFIDNESNILKKSKSDLKIPSKKVSNPSHDFKPYAIFEKSIQDLKQVHKKETSNLDKVKHSVEREDSPVAKRKVSERELYPSSDKFEDDRSSKKIRRYRERSRSPDSIPYQYRLKERSSSSLSSSSTSRSPSYHRSGDRSPLSRRSPEKSTYRSKSPSYSRHRSRSPDYRRHRSPDRYYSKYRSPEREHYRHRSKSPGYVRHRSKSPGYVRHRSKSPGYVRHRSKSPGYVRHRSKSPGYDRLRSKSPIYDRHRSIDFTKSRDKSSKYKSRESNFSLYSNDKEDKYKDLPVKGDSKLSKSRTISDTKSENLSNQASSQISLKQLNKEEKSISSNVIQDKKSEDKSIKSKDGLKVFNPDGDVKSIKQVHSTASDKKFSELTRTILQDVNLIEMLKKNESINERVRAINEMDLKASEKKSVNVPEENICTVASPITSSEVSVLQETYNSANMLHYSVYPMAPMAPMAPAIPPPLTMPPPPTYARASAVPCIIPQPPPPVSQLPLSATLPHPTSTIHHPPPINMLHPTPFMYPPQSHSLPVHAPPSNIIVEAKSPVKKRQSTLRQISFVENAKNPPNLSSNTATSIEEIDSEPPAKKIQFDLKSKLTKIRANKLDDKAKDYNEKVDDFLQSISSPSKKKESESKKEEAVLIERYKRLLEEKKVATATLRNSSDDISDIETMIKEASRKNRNMNREVYLKCLQLKNKSSEIMKQHIGNTRRLEDELKKIKAKLPNIPKNVLAAASNSKNADKSVPEIKYACYDCGNHACLTCGVLCNNLSNMLDHLQSDEHKKNLTKIDTQWIQDLRPTRSNTIGSDVTFRPVRGVEFIKPFEGFYCTLCSESLVDAYCAEDHMKSHSHLTKYYAFQREHPLHEQKLEISRQIKLSAIASLQRKQMIERKQQKEKETELLDRKIKEKVQREEDKKEKVEELEDVETSSNSVAKTSGIKVVLADGQVINTGSKLVASESKKLAFIGPAPNLKSRPKPWYKKFADKVKSDQQKSSNDDSVDTCEEKPPVKKEDEKSSSRFSECDEELKNKKPGSFSPYKAPKENIPNSAEKRGDSDSTNKNVDSSKTNSVIDNKNNSNNTTKFATFSDINLCDIKLPESVEKGMNKNVGSSKSMGIVDNQKDKNDSVYKNNGNNATKFVNSSDKNLDDIKLPEFVEKDMNKNVSSSKSMGVVDNQSNKNDSNNITKLVNVIDVNEKNVKLPGSLEKNSNVSTTTVLKVQPSNIEPLQKPPQHETVPAVKKQVLTNIKKTPLTEEEKDFYLLGIDKDDFTPLAVPKRPPSSVFDSFLPVKETVSEALATELQNVESMKPEASEKVEKSVENKLTEQTVLQEGHTPNAVKYESESNDMDISSDMEIDLSPKIDVSQNEDLSGKFEFASCEKDEVSSSNNRVISSVSCDNDQHSISMTGQSEATSTNSNDMEVDPSLNVVASESENLSYKLKLEHHEKDESSSKNIVKISNIVSSETNKQYSISMTEESETISATSKDVERDPSSSVVAFEDEDLSSKLDLERHEKDESSSKSTEVISSAVSSENDKQCSILTELSKDTTTSRDTAIDPSPDAVASEHEDLSSKLKLEYHERVESSNKNTELTSSVIPSEKDKQCITMTGQTEETDAISNGMKIQLSNVVASESEDLSNKLKLEQFERDESSSTNADLIPSVSSENDKQCSISMSGQLEATSTTSNDGEIQPSLNVVAAESKDLANKLKLEQHEKDESSGKNTEGLSSVSSDNDKQWSISVTEQPKLTDTTSKDMDIDPSPNVVAPRNEELSDKLLEFEKPNKNTVTPEISSHSPSVVTSEHIKKLNISEMQQPEMNQSVIKDLDVDTFSNIVTPQQDDHSGKLEMECNGNDKSTDKNFEMCENSSHISSVISENDKELSISVIGQSEAGHFAIIGDNIDASSNIATPHSEPSNQNTMIMKNTSHIPTVVASDNGGKPCIAVMEESESSSSAIENTDTDASSKIVISHNEGLSDKLEAEQCAIGELSGKKTDICEKSSNNSIVTSENDKQPRILLNELPETDEFIKKDMDINLSNVVASQNKLELEHYETDKSSSKSMEICVNDSQVESLVTAGNLKQLDLSVPETSDTTDPISNDMDVDPSPNIDIPENQSLSDKLELEKCATDGSTSKNIEIQENSSYIPSVIENHEQLSVSVMKQTETNQTAIEHMDIDTPPNITAPQVESLSDKLDLECEKTDKPDSMNHEYENSSHIPSVLSATNEESSVSVMDHSETSQSVFKDDISVSPNIATPESISDRSELKHSATVESFQNFEIDKNSSHIPNVSSDNERQLCVTILEKSETSDSCISPNIISQNVNFSNKLELEDSVTADSSSKSTQIHENSSHIASIIENDNPPITPIMKQSERSQSRIENTPINTLTIATVQTETLLDKLDSKHLETDKSFSINAECEKSSHIPSILSVTNEESSIAVMDHSKTSQFTTMDNKDASPNITTPQNEGISEKSELKHSATDESPDQSIANDNSSHIPDVVTAEIDEQLSIPVIEESKASDSHVLPNVISQSVDLSNKSDLEESDSSNKNTKIHKNSSHVPSIIEKDNQPSVSIMEQPEASQAAIKHVNIDTPPTIIASLQTESLPDKLDLEYHETDKSSSKNAEMCENSSHIPNVLSVSNKDSSILMDHSEISQSTIKDHVEVSPNIVTSQTESISIKSELKNSVTGETSVQNAANDKNSSDTLTVVSDIDQQPCVPIIEESETSNSRVPPKLISQNVDLSSQSAMEEMDIDVPPTIATLQTESLPDKLDLEYHETDKSSSKNAEVCENSSHIPNVLSVSNEKPNILKDHSEISQSTIKDHVEISPNIVTSQTESISIKSELKNSATGETSVQNAASDKNSSHTLNVVSADIDQQPCVPIIEESETINSCIPPNLISTLSNKSELECSLTDDSSSRNTEICEISSHSQSAIESMDIDTPPTIATLQIESPPDKLDLEHHKTDKSSIKNVEVCENSSHIPNVLSVSNEKPNILMDHSEISQSAFKDPVEASPNIVPSQTERISVKSELKSSATGETPVQNAANDKNSSHILNVVSSDVDQQPCIPIIEKTETSNSRVPPNLISTLSNKSELECSLTDDSSSRNTEICEISSHIPSVFENDNKPSVSIMEPSKISQSAIESMDIDTPPTIATLQIESIPDKLDLEHHETDKSSIKNAGVCENSSHIPNVLSMNNEGPSILMDHSEINQSTIKDNVDTYLNITLSQTESISEKSEFKHSAIDESSVQNIGNDKNSSNIPNVVSSNNGQEPCIPVIKESETSDSCVPANVISQNVGLSNKLEMEKTATSNYSSSKNAEVHENSSHILNVTSEHDKETSQSTIKDLHRNAFSAIVTQQKENFSSNIELEHHTTADPNKITEICASSLITVTSINDEQCDLSIMEQSEKNKVAEDMNIDLPSKEGLSVKLDLSSNMELEHHTTAEPNKITEISLSSLITVTSKNDKQCDLSIMEQSEKGEVAEDMNIDLPSKEGLSVKLELEHGERNKSFDKNTEIYVKTSQTESVFISENKQSDLSVTEILETNGSLSKDLVVNSSPIIGISENKSLLNKLELDQNATGKLSSKNTAIHEICPHVPSEDDKQPIISVMEQPKTSQCDKKAMDIDASQNILTSQIESFSNKSKFEYYEPKEPSSKNAEVFEKSSDTSEVVTDENIRQSCMLEEGHREISESTSENMEVCEDTHISNVSCESDTQSKISRSEHTETVDLAGKSVETCENSELYNSEKKLSATTDSSIGSSCNYEKSSCDNDLDNSKIIGEQNINKDMAPVLLPETSETSVTTTSVDDGLPVMFTSDDLAPTLVAEVPQTSGTALSTYEMGDEDNSKDTAPVLTAEMATEDSHCAKEPKEIENMDISDDSNSTIIDEETAEIIGVAETTSENDEKGARENAIPGENGTGEDAVKVDETNQKVEDAAPSV